MHTPSFTANSSAYQPESAYRGTEISFVSTFLVPNEDEAILRPSNIHRKPHGKPTLACLYQLSEHAVYHFLSTNHAWHDKAQAIPCPATLQGWACCLQVYDTSRSRQTTLRLKFCYCSWHYISGVAAGYVKTQLPITRHVRLELY